MQMANPTEGLAASLGHAAVHHRSFAMLRTKGLRREEADELGPQLFQTYDLIYC